MLRAEESIFASVKPFPCETLAGLVDGASRLNALLADTSKELQGWPEGLRHPKRPRHAETPRALMGEPPSLTKLEMLVLSAVQQPEP